MDKKKKIDFVPRLRLVLFGLLVVACQSWPSAAAMRPSQTFNSILGV